MISIALHEEGCCFLTIWGTYRLGLSCFEVGRGFLDMEVTQVQKDPYSIMLLYHVGSSSLVGETVFSLLKKSLIRSPGGEEDAAFL